MFPIHPSEHFPRLSGASAWHPKSNPERRRIRRSRDSSPSAFAPHCCRHRWGYCQSVPQRLHQQAIWHVLWPSAKLAGLAAVSLAGTQDDLKQPEFMHVHQTYRKTNTLQGFLRRLRVKKMPAFDFIRDHPGDPRFNGKPSPPWLGALASWWFISVLAARVTHVFAICQYRPFPANRLPLCHRIGPFSMNFGPGTSKINGKSRLELGNSPK